MGEQLADDSWLGAFNAAQPRPLLTSLQKRLHTSTAHTAALTELYKQRATIEQQYADSLQKLAKTADSGAFSGKSGNDWAKSSGEARLWDSVLSEINETSASHSTLSAIIRTDFEQPIRDLPSKIIPWRRIGDQDASLDKALKDYEKVAAKLEKASSKSKSNKLDMLQADLGHLTQTLSTLSPMVYTTYQKLDEERLRALKEIVVRWGTVKGDMAGRDSARAEAIISSLLAWETNDEVASVGNKLGGGTGSGHNPLPRIPDSANTTPQSNRRLSMATATSASHDFSPRPSNARSNGSSTTVNNVNSASGTPGTSFTGGFKSMLGRTKTMGARNRSGSNATSTRSGTARDTFEAIGEEPRAPVEAASTSAPPVDEEGFSVAPADRHRNPWEDPDELIAAPSKDSEYIRPQAPVKPTGSVFNQVFTSSPNASRENLSPTSDHQPSRLNLALAPRPIEEDEEARQKALQKMQKTLQLPPSQPTRRSTISRGRRDVRNTVFGGLGDDGNVVSPGLTLPKLADEPEEQLADSPMSSRSHTFNRDIPSPSPVARRSSLSSVSSNNPFDSPGLTGPGSGLVSMPAYVAVSSADNPGLRATMNEVINVIFKNKAVSKIQITGEIHLSLRPSLAQPTTGPIHIRLSSFERLEKIAPNPAFLAQVPDKPGEYFLNSEVLAGATSKAAGGGKGTLLFKYVVHVQPGKELNNLPLILDPAFQCKSGETRMILHYTTPPSSSTNTTLAGFEELKDATFVAAFAPGPPVSNVQAKPPGGVWSPVTRRMTWKVSDLGDRREGKIIAKFTTPEGDAALTPQGVQASWGIEGGLVSGLGIEVVHGELEEVWDFEEISKGTLTGKYLAEV